MNQKVILLLALLSWFLKLCCCHSVSRHDVFFISRVFALLTFLGQKSVGSGRGSQVIDAILRALSAQLHGSAAPVPDPVWPSWTTGGPHVDTHLVSWLLLYLSLCLDALTPARKTEAEKTKDSGECWVLERRLSIRLLLIKFFLYRIIRTSKELNFEQIFSVCHSFSCIRERKKNEHNTKGWHPLCILITYEWFCLVQEEGAGGPG